MHCLRHFQPYLFSAP